MKISTIVLFAMLFFSTAKAQNVDPENFPDLRKKLITADSIFWVAYNQCDIETMGRYLAEDLEFYHDKAGVTKTLKTLNENVRKGLCGNADWRLRREVVPGTIEIYIMENYGAIFHGEHLFYINEKGKEEYLDGHAQFTHLWKYDSGQWKMTRILSFDHKPAPERFRE